MKSVHFLYCPLYSCSPVLYLLLFPPLSSSVPLYPVLTYHVPVFYCLIVSSLLSSTALSCFLPSHPLVPCPVLSYSVVLYLFVTYTNFCASSTTSRSFLDSRFILPSVRVFVFLYLVLFVSYFLHSALKFETIEALCSNRKPLLLSPHFCRRGEAMNVGNLINSQG